MYFPKHKPLCMFLCEPGSFSSTRWYIGYTLDPVIVRLNDTLATLKIKNSQLHRLKLTIFLWTTDWIVLQFHVAVTKVVPCTEVFRSKIIFMKLAVQCACSLFTAFSMVIFSDLWKFNMGAMKLSMLTVLTNFND